MASTAGIPSSPRPGTSRDNPGGDPRDPGVGTRWEPEEPAGTERSRPRGARLPPPTEPPEGPAFLLVKLAGNKSLKGTNPFSIRRWIIHTCGEVATAKVIRSGALLVKTLTTEQNHNLMKATSFLGRQCSVEVAERLNSVQGLIYSPDLKNLSEETLLAELAPQGVIEVMRFASKPKATSSNPLVRVRFSGLALPSRLFCGYLAVPVRPWVPGPRQCRRCWEFGHMATTCRPTKQERCGRCSATDHSTKGCKREAYCYKCREAHAMWRRECRAWQTAKEGAREAEAYADQRSASGPWGPPTALPYISALSAEDFPPLPPPTQPPPPPPPSAPRATPNDGATSETTSPRRPTDTTQPEHDPQTPAKRRREEEPAAPSKKRQATPGSSRVITRSGETRVRGERLSYSSESDDDGTHAAAGGSYDQCLMRALVARVDPRTPRPRPPTRALSDSAPGHHSVIRTEEDKTGPE